MSSAKLAEEIKRLLPEEKYKRIRQAIMAAATAGKAEARTVKDEIAQENRLKTGLLAVGTIAFTSPTSANLDLFAWVIDYVNFQPGPVTKTVAAPDANFPRPDIFCGKADGTIAYYPGSVDAEGNAQIPNIPEGEVLLRTVIRNPDGTDEVDDSAPDTTDFVSKSATGTQTIASLLAFTQLTRPSGISRVPIMSNGGILTVGGSPAQNDVYTTTFGGGGTWSKLVTINLSIPDQVNYYVALELAGISTNYEKGNLWIHFRVNESTGDLEVNQLKCFGEMVPSKYKLVRIDSDTYAVFAHHDESDSNYKFRPIFQYGATEVTEYHHQAARTSLPAGAQYNFSAFGANQVNQETKFLSGGFWVYSGTGLIFDTVLTECQFPGSNDIITIPGIRINLEDFPELDNGTDPQFVRPVWNQAGQVVPLFGPASSDPQVPSVSDPVAELAGDPILLGAGATSVPPVQIATGTIFAEGAAGEATLGHSGAGSSNFTSFVEPISGSISVELTGVQGGTTTNATPPAAVTIADFTAISIKVRLKAPMAPGHSLGMFFRKSGAIVTKTRMLPIDRSSLGVQILGIPLSQFESSEATVDQLVLRWYRTADATTHAGYFFDDWVLQGGVQPPPVAGDGVRSVTGDGVGGTAKDVVLTFPTPAQIGAYTKTEADAKFETIENVQELASDLTDLENQVQDIEEEVKDHEERITELENAGGYQEARISESNTILFDWDYIIGNAAARSGNILANFSGAKLGATFRMRHNSSSVFTMPSSFVVLSGEYELSTDNYIWGVLTSKVPSSEKVEITISQIIA
jgi:hypothetical protein